MPREPECGGVRFRPDSEAYGAMVGVPGFQFSFWDVPDAACFVTPDRARADRKPFRELMWPACEAYYGRAPVEACVDWVRENLELFPEEFRGAFPKAAGE